MYLVKKNNNDQWIVIKKGAKRASKVFDSKAEAIIYAKNKYPNDYEVENEIEVNDKKYKIKTSGKKKSKAFIILFSLVMIAVLIIGILWWFDYIKIPGLDKIKDKEPVVDNNSNNQISDEPIVENMVYDDFQIHFLTMGDSSFSSNYSEYSGDSIYIKAGDNDILIDAGSRQGSAGYIKKYVDNYCTDGKLEYVIATHADQDHIAGFVGTNAYPGIFESYEIDILIDFAKTNKTTALYSNYVTLRNTIDSNGTDCYTAADCYDNANGAKSTYTLGEGISFTILYNYYYFNNSSDENNYSVCTLFTYNDLNFLFTGDLEEDGEERLAAYYDGSTEAKTLPHCELFKAGHHGSKTSSNESLLSKITPNICCVCCCAGSTEYTANYNNIFPTQDFINRIAKYTDRVYVTSIFNEETLDSEKMNGDIIVSSNGTNIGLKASNNLTKLKDTDWFNETIYVDSDNNICSGKGKEDFFTTTTSGVVAVKRRVWPSA